MEPVSLATAAILIFAIYTHNAREPPRPIPKTDTSDISRATLACESSMLKKFEKGSLYFECGKIK